MTTTSPLVQGVDFLAVPTRDFDRACDFYENVLGLRKTKRWGDMPGQEFETGSLTIAIMDPTAFGQEFSPMKVPLALRVADVPAAKAALEAKGVTFHTEVIDSGVCHQAIFSDPDGNALDLHHRYAD